MLALAMQLLCAVATPLNHSESKGKPAPHIFFVLVDDLGSADVGFTRNAGFNPATQPEVPIYILPCETINLFNNHTSGKDANTR